MPMFKHHRKIALSVLFALGLGLAVTQGKPAAAETFAAVEDRAAFLSHVSGRTLRLAMFDVTIAVNRDGTITGQAMGWDLTGSWAWDKGLFCRQIDWSGSLIARNGQLVEVADGKAIRFTVDGGRGRSAVFKIQ